MCGCATGRPAKSVSATLMKMTMGLMLFALSFQRFTVLTIATIPTRLKKSFIAPWNGGFGVNARWKGLSVRADFNWSAEKYIFNATNWYIKDPTTSVARNTNASVELLNVWTKPGDVTTIPNRFDLYGQTQEIQADSRFVEDCSFLRLKNLTVSYSLPKSWLNAVKLSDVSFHFTGRNLWTLTEFKGVDPEYEGNVCHIMYPNTRQYEFGVEVSF